MSDAATADQTGARKLTEEETDMRRLITSVAVAAALVLTGHGSEGQPGSPPANASEGRPPRPPIDTALDVNCDEVIDAGEIAGALVALKKLDLDGDGQLTPEEYRPSRSGRTRQEAAPHEPQGADSAGRPGPGTADGTSPAERPRPPIVAVLDADGDGEIAAGEIANAVQALAKLDVNGDGTLSPEEYRPPRPGRPRGFTSGGGPR